MRGVQERSRRGLTRPGPLARARLLLALTLFAAGLPGCGRAPAATDDVRVAVTFVPEKPSVGRAVLTEISVLDRQDRMVEASGLRVEAHMTHPGMAPVIVTPRARPDGVHEADLQFTMAGDWMMHVTGTLADGRRLDEWIEVRGVEAAAGAAAPSENETTQ